MLEMKEMKEMILQSKILILQKNDSSTENEDSSATKWWFLLGTLLLKCEIHFRGSDFQKAISVAAEIEQVSHNDDFLF